MIRVGDIRRINVPPLDSKEVYALIYEIMNDKQRKDFEEFPFEIPGVARFRVNAFNQNRGSGGVFRTIPSKVLTMDELGMGDVFSLARGLITVTGPTGSGKSTTLAAMMDYINTNRYQHILTIEDPIEFVHESKKCLVNQREVHRDTLGFNEALRSALREDSCAKTIRLALGMKLFCKTIDRIIDVFPSGRKSRWFDRCCRNPGGLSQTLLVGGGREPRKIIDASDPLIREDKVAQMYSAIQTPAGHAADQCLKGLVDDH